GHLRMNFRAVDERGRIAGSDRDLAALQQRLSDRSRQSVSRSIGKSTGASLGSATPSMPAALRGSLSPSTGSFSVERDDLTDWTFGDLPEGLDRKVAGGVVRGYPAIIDRGKSVSVRLEATADAAHAATRDGVLRLVLLNVPSPASYVQNHLTSPEKLALAASP